MKALNRVQTSKIKIPAYSLLPYAENIAWQLWFVVQFCFLFNSFLEIKSSISILDITTKNSDWSSAQRQSHLWTLKKISQFNFQFVYYGSWQIWKPLNRVQTSKIKKFQRTLYCLWLKTLRDNYDLYNFVSYSTPSWKFRAQFLFQTVQLRTLIDQVLSGRAIWGLWKKTAIFKSQFVYYGSWQICKPLNRVQTSKIKKIPAYSLLPYAENIEWQLWFVVQFCFLFNSSLKFKSPISLLDSTIKKSDW